MTSPLERKDDIASAWVARMDAGPLSIDDEADLERWLSEDRSHRGVLLRTQAAWLAGDHVRAGHRPEDFDHAELDTHAKAVWPRRTVIAGLAASLAFVAGKFALQASTSKYTTGLGEIRRVPLDDGSVITINSGSELAVHYEAKRRQIDIAEGEAWFEVAKDADRPFVVTAGAIKVRAVGTAFSVRLREKAVEVLVTEGIVEAWGAAGRSSSARLVAGQIALIGEKAGPARVAEEPSSVDRALAWRGGLIDLQGTTLAEAAEEFNRYNVRKLVIDDQRIASEQLDGVFRINDPEGFARAVQTSLNVAVELTGPGPIRIGSQKS